MLSRTKILSTKLQAIPNAIISIAPKDTSSRQCESFPTMNSWATLKYYYSNLAIDKGSLMADPPSSLFHSQVFVNMLKPSNHSPHPSRISGIFILIFLPDFDRLFSNCLVKLKLHILSQSYPSESGFQRLARGPVSPERPFSSQIKFINPSLGAGDPSANSPLEIPPLI